MVYQPLLNDGALSYQFDRYDIKCREQFLSLKEEKNLKGALIITGDVKHVGVHKFFWLVQKVKELTMRLFEGAVQPPVNLNHAMVVVGWDSKEKALKRAKTGLARQKVYSKDDDYYDRPLLAHAVHDGVKINAVDYWRYDDKDVDHMVIYIPKDEKLRHEFYKSAKQVARLSSQKMWRCKFSWSCGLKSLFCAQIQKKPTDEMIKKVSYTAADILLKSSLMDRKTGKKTRSFFCTHFVMTILQASVLTCDLSREQKKKLVLLGTREKIAEQIYERIKEKDFTDKLSKTYWENRICYQVDPSTIMSAYAALVLNQCVC